MAHMYMTSCLKHVQDSNLPAHIKEAQIESLTAELKAIEDELADLAEQYNERS